MLDSPRFTTGGWSKGRRTGPWNTPGLVGSSGSNSFILSSYTPNPAGVCEGRGGEEGGEENQIKSSLPSELVNTSGDITITTRNISLESQYQPLIVILCYFVFIKKFRIFNLYLLYLIFRDLKLRVTYCNNPSGNFYS